MWRLLMRVEKRLMVLSLVPEPTRRHIQHLNDYPVFQVVLFNFLLAVSWSTQCYASAQRAELCDSCTACAWVETSKTHVPCYERQKARAMTPANFYADELICGERQIENWKMSYDACVWVRPQTTLRGGTNTWLHRRSSYKISFFPLQLRLLKWTLPLCLSRHSVVWVFLLIHSVYSFLESQSSHTLRTTPAWLSQDLNYASDWAAEWGMLFNTEKSEHLAILPRKSDNTNPRVTMNGKTIPHVTSHKHVGVNGNNTLSWHQPIDKVYTSCARRTGLIRRLSYTRLFWNEYIWEQNCQNWNTHAQCGVVDQHRSQLRCRQTFVDVTEQH